MRGLVLLLYGCGFTLIALSPISHGAWELAHHRWLASFRPAEAIVTATWIDEVASGRLKGLAPRVAYRFRVAGEEHRGTMIRWHDQLPLGTSEGGPPPEDVVVWRSDARTRQQLAHLLRRYPVGASVTAYYDPGLPSTSCLVYVPFVPWQHGAGLWFGLGFVVIGWAFTGVVWLVVRYQDRQAGRSRAL